MVVARGQVPRGARSRAQPDYGPVEFWTIPKLWPGETVFVMGGGPSVATQNLELLRGQRVIAINSSYERYPDADFIYSMDTRWLQHHRAVLENRFAGKVVTCSAMNWPGILKVRRFPRPGMNDDPRTLAPEFTSMSGAIQLAAKLGGARIVTLGLDGGRMVNGRTHHHTPHPAQWRTLPEGWRKHHGDLKRLAGQLKARGIGIVNASPGTLWPDLWPVVSLDAAIAWADLPQEVAHG